MSEFTEVEIEAAARAILETDIALVHGQPIPWERLRLTQAGEMLKMQAVAALGAAREVRPLSWSEMPYDDDSVGAELERRESDLMMIQDALVAAGHPPDPGDAQGMADAIAALAAAGPLGLRNEERS